MRYLVAVLALLGLTACSAQGTAATHDAAKPPTATVTVTETATPSPAIASPSPTASSSPTSSPSFVSGVDIKIVCYGKHYSAHAYTTPQDAWPHHYDYCDGSTILGGTPSAREQMAMQTAYHNSKLSGLKVLYEICAASAPSSVKYLKTAGSPAQLREIKGALILCPNHPLKSLIESYIGGAQERNRLEASGRIFYSGTYRVRKKIQPGTYFAKPGGDDCYWERTDRAGNIIANTFTTGLRVEVTIEPSDYSFTSQGCGKWQPVS